MSNDDYNLDYTKEIINLMEDEIDCLYNIIINLTEYLNTHQFNNMKEYKLKRIDNVIHFLRKHKTCNKLGISNETICNDRLLFNDSINNLYLTMLIDRMDLEDT